MKRVLNRIFATIAVITLGGLALGQTQQRTTPDCILSFSFTATGNSADLNNIVQTATGNSIGGCVAWEVNADAFNSGAGTLTFQAASTSNAAGTGPGSYSTFGGSVITGATSTSSFPWTFTGGPTYYPWLRVSATISAGTIRGTIQGWKNPSAAGGSGGGTVPTTITNLTPCNNGSNTIVTQPFTFTASGNTQIVAATSGTIHVCGFITYTDAATFLKLTTGTGANCITGTADLTSYPTGSTYTILGLAIDFPLNAPAAKALCVNSATAVNGGGTISFVQN